MEFTFSARTPEKFRSWERGVVDSLGVIIILLPTKLLRGLRWGLWAEPPSLGLPDARRNPRLVAQVSEPINLGDFARGLRNT